MTLRAAGWQKPPLAAIIKVLFPRSLAMKTLMLVFTAAMFASAAQAAPFAKGDPTAGKVLHDKSCVS
jgi:hypothetical protein